MVSCKIIYSFNCFECQKKEEKSFLWWEGQTLQIPSLPEGWVSIGDAQFCDEHEIFVNVDRIKNYPANRNSRNKPALVKRED
jgi:hypothetical protein